MFSRCLALVTVSVALSSGSLFADTMAWEVTGNNQFGTINLTSGAFSQISDLGYTPAGMGEFNDHLYVPMSYGNDLMEVDRAGHVSFVGNSNVAYYAFGSTNNGLYMVDSSGQLWNINPGTGAATSIGSTHLDMSVSHDYGMSTGSNVLYLSLGNNIYTINTDTGTASFVGNSGTTDFGALVDVSGTVYGSTVMVPLSIYTFDPVTGKAAFLTNTQGPDYSFGMAPIVPEPASFALFGVGAAFLGSLTLKRRRA